MTSIDSRGTIGTDAGQGGVCRVLLVHRHRLFREGLRALLAREKEFLVVGEAADGSEALQRIAFLQPDVVITDLQLSAGSRVGHLEEIHLRFPRVALLVLSRFRAHEVAARVRRAGALGYLLKERGLTELLTALREVAAGRPYPAAPGSSI